MGFSLRNLSVWYFSMASESSLILGLNVYSLSFWEGYKGEIGYLGDVFDFIWLEVAGFGVGESVLVEGAELFDKLDGGPLFQGLV
jgi:hypothetical protein